ncbi:MAG: hypothetical protein O3A00_08930 [Planctomycetota bacterium]|nr:hypothetical protein [Planctomycetota bacterium]
MTNITLPTILMGGDGDDTADDSSDRTIAFGSAQTGATVEQVTVNAGTTANDTVNLFDASCRSATPVSRKPMTGRPIWSSRSR